MKRRRVANLLALAVLALLSSGHPMHPYQMASLLRSTGKERDMRVKVGSLYTVVRNLERHGLIEATGSRREGRRPERTDYAITGAGRAELRDWLRELVAEPESEYPRFQAALSVLSTLHPDEATSLLRERLRALEADIAARQAELERDKDLWRLFKVESEYSLALRQAEASWVRSLVARLDDGTFPDLAAWREYHETGNVPAELTRILTEEGSAQTD